MDCKSFEEKMSLYIDDMLDEVEKKEFEQHLNKCNKCKVSFKNMKSIINYARNCEEIELPKDFNEKLRIKLKEIKQPKGYKNKFKVLSTIAAAFLIVIISVSAILMVINFPGNSFKMGKSMVEKRANYEAQEAPMQMASESKPSQPELGRGEAFDYSTRYGIDSNKSMSLTDEEIGVKSKMQNRKIINEAYIELDVEDYDKVFNEIIDYVKFLGGFIENSETGYQHNKRYEENKEPLKRGYLRIRVPSDKFEDTIKYVDSLGIIKRKNLTGRDVTEQYYDVENRVENLKIQEERLREILRKAEKVEEILMIENELRRIRTEIDHNTSVLKKWDSLVALATINISLNEVEILNKEIKNVDKSLLERSKEGFITTVNSIIKLFEETVVFLITILPIIILISILLAIAYFLYKKINIQKH